jgi:hypothetical protein
MTTVHHERVGPANTLRQARLRPAFAHKYPSVPVGEWVPAAELAARALGKKSHGAPLPATRDRVLPDGHFEFRGGGEEARLRYRARTRWVDYPRMFVR